MARPTTTTITDYGPDTTAWESQYEDAFWAWLETHGLADAAHASEAQAASYYQNWLTSQANGTTNTPPTGDLTEAQADLKAFLTGWLNQYGLGGLSSLVEEALVQGWTQNEALLQIRASEAWKTRFAGNAIRQQNGFNLLTEDAYLAYEDAFRGLAREYGFNTPTDEDIALGIGSNRSAMELKEMLEVEQRVKEYGPQVKGVFERLTGADISDNDLREFFNPNIPTPKWNELYRKARIMGQPMSLGLGERSEAEADALLQMGVDPDEAFRRYQQVGLEKDRFSRLASIEGLITGNLPNDFGDFLKNVDNKTLVDAFVFQRPDSLREIQNLTIREAGRHNSKAANPAGYLSPEERAAG